MRLTHNRPLGRRFVNTKSASDAAISLHFGNYPRNGQEFALCVSGYGAMPNLDSLADVDTLIRLFKGAPMDHPFEAEIDVEELLDEPKETPHAS